MSKKSKKYSNFFESLDSHMKPEVIERADRGMGVKISGINENDEEFEILTTKIAR